MPTPSMAQPERERTGGRTTEATTALLQQQYSSTLANPGHPSNEPDIYIRVLKAGEGGELSGINRNLWAAYNPVTGQTEMYRLNQPVSSFGTADSVLDAVGKWVDRQNSGIAMQNLGEDAQRRVDLISSRESMRRTDERMQAYFNQGERPAQAAAETPAQAGARAAGREELPGEQGRKLDRLGEQMRAGTFLEPVTGRSTQAPATPTAAAPETLSAEQARRLEESLNLGTILNTGPAMGVGTEQRRREETPRQEEAAPREEQAPQAEAPARPAVPVGGRAIVAGRPITRPREEATAEAVETAHAGAGYERIGVSFDYSTEGLGTDERRRLQAQVNAACSARDPYTLATFLQAHLDLEITGIRFSGIDRTQYSADSGAGLASELLRYRRESA